MAVGRNGSHGVADLIAAGIASHFCRSENIGDVEKEIIKTVVEMDPESERFEVEVLRAVRRKCQRVMPYPPLMTVKKSVENAIKDCEHANEVIDAIESLKQNEEKANGTGTFLGEFCAKFLDGAKMGSIVCHEAYFQHVELLDKSHKKFLRTEDSLKRKEIEYAEERNRWLREDKIPANYQREADKPKVAKLPNIEAVMAREYALAQYLITREDFRVGVQHVVVDKIRDSPPDFFPQELDNETRHHIGLWAGPEDKEMFQKHVLRYIHGGH